MDVRCEKCKTEYELEDSRVTNKGVTVKCTQCGHLFRVRRRAGTGVTEAPTDESGTESKGRKKTVPGRFAGAKPARQIPDLNVGGSQKREPQKSAEKKATEKAANDTTSREKAAKGHSRTEEQSAAKRWLIRRTSGEVFQFKELTTLQQWIVEEKVDREDEISKSGKAWEKLGAIEELKSFFTVVDQARQSRLVQAKSESGQEKIQRTKKSDEAAANEELKDTNDVDLATAPTLPPARKTGEQKTPSKIDATETHPTEGKKPITIDPVEQGALSAEQRDDVEEEDIPTAEMKKGRESAAYEMGSGVFKEDVEGPSEMGKLTSDDKEPGRTAAWEKEGFRVSKKAVEPTAEITISERDALQRPGSGAMKVIAVIVIGAIIGLAAVIGIWKWDKIVDLLAGEEDKAKDKYSHARALVLKDTEESLSRAKEIFRIVYGAKKSAEARAGQAKVAALQALYRKWKADSLEEQAQRIAQKRANTDHLSKTAPNEEKESKKPTAPKKSEREKEKPQKVARKRAKIPELTPSPEAAALRKKASEIRGEAAVWAKEALGHARAAYDIKKNPLTSRILALSLLAAGRDSAEAKKHLQYALNEQGNDPNTLYVKAVLETTEEKWSKARQSLRQAIAIHRKQSTKIMYRAHYLMARLSLKLEEPGKAKNELQSILATNKNHRQAEHLLKLITQEETSPGEEAIAEQTADAGVEPVDAGKTDTGEAPEESPTDKTLVGDYDTLVRKGDRFSETGRVDDAVKAYSKALQQKPSGVEALTGLAYCHLDKGRSSKAKSTFRKVLSLSPGHGEALIGMAEIYKKESNWKNSLEYFKRYLNYHPGGRRSGLAQRNVKELEERIERTEPREIPRPGEEAATPGKVDGETKDPRPEPEKVVIPPAEKEPAEPRPETKSSTEDKKDAPSPRPGASSGDKPDTRENPPTKEN